MKHARGVIILTCIVSACLGANAAKLYAPPPPPPIESINAHLGDTVFTIDAGKFGLGQITIDEVLPVTTETAAGQTTMSLNFQLIADLASDSSAGGYANGLFSNGTILITLPEDEGVVYFEADNLTLRLEEPFDNIGLLGGGGAFDVVGGFWEYRFSDNGSTRGIIEQMVFRISPKNLDAFDRNFTGTSDVTLLPEEGGGDVPEPATLILVGTGALGAAGWLRRRRAR
jgi:hypothetical protein